MGRTKKVDTLAAGNPVNKVAQEVAGTQTNTGAQEVAEFEEDTDFNMVMTAQDIADNPMLLSNLETLITEAKSIIAERNKPKPLTVEEMAAINYQRLVDKYGKDFVTAKKGTQQTYFTRKSWVGLGKNRNGWVEVTPQHPETANR